MTGDERAVIVVGVDGSDASRDAIVPSDEPLTQVARTREGKHYDNIRIGP